MIFFKSTTNLSYIDSYQYSFTRNESSGDIIYEKHLYEYIMYIYIKTTSIQYIIKKKRIINHEEGDRHIFCMINKT